ncbi:MAG TPA: hypothetical protein VF630_13570 [Hymenobacter sp.]|jgi:hypothetical protein
MRRLPYLLLIASGLLFSAHASLAQRRIASETALQPEAQVELALKGNDYLLAGLSLVAPRNNGGGTFAGGQVRLGYEHFWTESWSGGATLRVIGGPENGFGDLPGQAGNIIPGVLLRHTSRVGGFTFGQRLGAEYGTTFDVLSSDIEDRALARLRFDVERYFSAGGKVGFRPRVAYEVAAYLRLQRDLNETKERAIDLGSLRAEVGLRLSPGVDLTPWGAFQTTYINSLPSFDANGKQVGGGRTNLVIPVVGLDVRLTLGRRDALTKRQQLPTQH